MSEKVSVLEALQTLNKYISQLHEQSEYDQKKTRRYTQVTKLLLVAEKILEKDMIENDKKGGDP
jgi:hypothetical protein